MQGLTDRKVEARRSGSILLWIGAGLVLGAIGIILMALWPERGTDSQHLPNPESGILLAGGTSQLCLELADEPEERSRGLSGRTSIGDYDGMAFVFSPEAFLAIDALRSAVSPTVVPESLLVETPFWMRDTYIPLDLIYVGANGRVLDVATMEPCLDGNCRSYPPPQPYLYALELPAGWAAEFGIRNGTILELGEKCIPFDRD